MDNFKNIRENPVLPTYFAKPKGEGPFPAVLLFMHAHGVDSSQQKVLDDLAEAGFYGIGGDAYQDGKFNFQTQTDDLIFEAFNVLLSHFKSMPDVDSSRLGLIGFCMGGRHAYLQNARSKDFKAVVSYYGFPHRDGGESTTPQNLINQFHAPVLSIFGDLDRGIPMDVVNAYIDASSKVSNLHKTVVYEGAGHGFLNPDSRNYHPKASEQAWMETLDFFNKYL